MVDHVRRQAVRHGRVVIAPTGGSRAASSGVSRRTIRGRPVVAVEALEGELGRAPTELDRVVVDDRDHRVGDAGGVEVAERDDRRRPAAVRRSPREQPDGVADVRREHRGRRLVEREHPPDHRLDV